MQYPMNEVRISSYWGNRTYTLNGKKVSDFHYGIDIIGKDSGKCPVYAVEDGKCIAKSTNDGVGGWYVVLEHKYPTATYITRYWHFSSFDSNYKVGDMVKKGQVLGMEGATGNATGNHLHFELWVCPKDYVYKSSERTKYAVNPINYLMVEKHQTTTLDLRKALDYTTETIEGTLIVSNPSVRQRIEPSTRYNETSRGNIPVGTYQVARTTNNDSYDWVEVNGLWVAIIEGATELVPERNELDKVTEELEVLRKKVKELENKLDIVMKENEELKNEIKRYTPMTVYIKE